jgi:hypothetical protein
MGGKETAAGRGKGEYFALTQCRSERQNTAVLPAEIIDFAAKATSLACS